MKFSFKLLEKVKNQTGVTAVIVAISLTMLIGFAALAIDVGYIYATKNELQNVADASALAATGYMGTIYKTLSYSEQQTYEFDRSDIVNVVNEVAQKNKAAGINIVINDSDVTIGKWKWPPDPLGTDPLKEIDPPIVGKDAVRVIARRDGSANLPITTFFARIFGITEVNVYARATAALTGPATVAEGVLKTPFSLSENNFRNGCPPDEIIFSPTTASCAGWHNFFDSANASTMADKMLGLIQGDVQEYDGLVSGPEWLKANFDMNKSPDPKITPEAGIGDEFKHQGGKVASLFLGGVLGNKDNDINLPEEIIGQIKNPAPFPALFDYFRRRDDDGGNDSIWTATVPVYEDDDVCVNPSGAIPIIGFATIEVRMPNPPPDSSVSVFVYCDLNFVEGRGGGVTSGNIKGTIANLVEGTPPP